MYLVSPMTPIFFSPSTDTTGTECSYMQLFSPSDEIMLQVISRSESRAIVGHLLDLCNGTSVEIPFKIWSMNESDKLHYHIITGLSEGYYAVEINGRESKPFRITANENELENTTLIQYSMKDNRQRQDSVFWISGEQHFFDWRVHGGFKDDNWSFEVDNEQFVDNVYNRYDVFSAETTNKSFTLGSSIGCPIWYGELLNRLMSCTYVYFNGERVVRSEGRVPEIQKVRENKRSYIFRLALSNLMVVDYTES